MNDKLKNNTTHDKSKNFKVKLMVKGFTQEECVNYNKMFSYIAKYVTICVVYALVVIFNLNHMNIIITYFYVSL